MEQSVIQTLMGCTLFFGKDEMSFVTKNWSFVSIRTLSGKSAVI